MREPGGKVRLKQSVNLVGAGAATGRLWGGMVGSLFGLLLLNPLLGFVTGAAFGAGAGAWSRKLADYGIDDDFIRSIGQTLQPNTSALFVLVRKVQRTRCWQSSADSAGESFLPLFRPSRRGDCRKRWDRLASRSLARPPHRLRQLRKCPVARDAD